MKLNYFTILLVFCMFVFLGSMQQTNAQLDEMQVQWETSPGSGEPLLNALHDAVMYDTLADGSHVQNRVYKLLKGGFYWNTDRLDNSGYHLRIEGEAGDPNDPFGNPPVIQRHYNDAHDFVDDKLIVGNGDLTLKNLYIIHCDDDGVQTAYQPIELSGSGKRFTFDNVIFERSNFAMVAVTNPDNDIFFTNCTFRNLIGEPSTQQWEGRGMSFWIDQDTIIVENNTFFNVEFTPFQLEGGAANYIRFNHNTLINIGRNMAIAGQEWREAYFANNLLVNPFWHGEGYSDVSDPNRDPETIPAGIWGIDDLPSKYGPEEGRRILLANTYAWRDPQFAAYYADTIATEPFTNPRTNEYINTYDQMVVVDTMWLANKPAMPTYFSTSFIDSMIMNIKDIRAGVTPATPYFWMIPQLPGGGNCNVCPSWPLPEDFSYTDANLMTAGTDGLPIGNLNYFPTSKADFESNKDSYIAQLEALAGSEVIYPVVDKAECEDGTLAGDAIVETFEGFSYVQMDGGGYFEWTFDLPSAGSYDFAVWQHMRGNTQRGQHTFINDVEIHDAAHGWGELIYDVDLGPAAGIDLNSWQWVTFTQADLNEAGALDFPAGENKIRISSSWGYQNFAGIDLREQGTETPVIQLRVPDLTDYDVVQLQAEGAAYVPSAFKTVQLGGNGSVEMMVNAPTAGDYGLVIFYQAPAGSQDVTVEIDSQPINVSLTGTGVPDDSTGLNVLTSVVSLSSAGDKTVKITGSNVLVDWIQFVRKDIVSSVKGRSGVPNGFELSQNYPNPFNPTTNINFSIAKASNVKLIVYNVLGQKVKTLVNTFMNAGAYTVDFNGTNLASGVYLYNIEAGDFRISKKMILLK